MVMTVTLAHTGQDSNKPQGQTFKVKCCTMLAYCYISYAFHHLRTLSLMLSDNATWKASFLTFTPGLNFHYGDVTVGSFSLSNCSNDTNYSRIPLGLHSFPRMNSTYCRRHGTLYEALNKGFSSSNMWQIKAVRAFDAFLQKSDPSD